MATTGDHEPRVELQEVVRIPKNDTTDLVFSTTVHNGKTYFDIREFTNTPAYKSPTKKGLRVPAELIGEFFRAVDALKSALSK